MNLNEAMQEVLLRADEFMEKLLGEQVEIICVGSSSRINPCIFCGHTDCLTFNEVSPTLHCFSCDVSMNYLQLAEHVLNSKTGAIKFVEEFLNTKLFLKKEDDAETRLYQIREIAAKFYHGRMMNDE